MFSVRQIYLPYFCKLPTVENVWIGREKPGYDMWVTLPTHQISKVVHTFYPLFPQVFHKLIQSYCQLILSTGPSWIGCGKTSVAGGNVCE